jgi:hypothetical protein
MANDQSSTSMVRSSIRGEWMVVAVKTTAATFGVEEE